MQLGRPPLHSGAAKDIAETTKLPAIPEVAWQQPQETNLIDIHKNSATTNNTSAHMPEFKRRMDLELQAWPIRET